MLKTIPATSEQLLSNKVSAVRIILSYLDFLHVNWGQMDEGHDDAAADILYSILPHVDRITAASGTNFANNLGDRIIDVCNEIGVAHSKRISLQTHHIPGILWIFHGILATSMFYGIAVIYSGSQAFNFSLCCVCTILIGTSTLVIADLDSPFSGEIQLKRHSLDAMRANVEAILSDPAKLSVDIADQSMKLREEIAAVVLQTGESGLEINKRRVHTVKFVVTMRAAFGAAGRAKISSGRETLLGEAVRRHNSGSFTLNSADP